MSVLESINAAVAQQLVERNPEVVEYVKTHRYEDTDEFSTNRMLNEGGNDLCFYEESDDWFDNLIWQ